MRCSPNYTNKIGAVFTPLRWAKFAIDQFGIFDKWIKGASIFDPTMGEGNLIFALIEKGIDQGYSIQDLPIHRIYGVELNKGFYTHFFKQSKELYNIDFPKENFWNEDIFFIENEKRFDILFGNPPWQNFVDLPEDYKVKIKDQFFKYDLIRNPQDLLLGNSRIDIAALVLQKTIQHHLRENGEAIFFVPLSIFLNDGANRFFRKYRVNGIEYCVQKIFDFNNIPVFDGISTRYGLIHIVRDHPQKFPIEYLRWEETQWVKYHARPLFQKDNPLSIFDSENLSFDFQPIRIKKHSQPRQGVNTCGANHIFVFDSIKEIDAFTFEISNRTIKALLPKQYIYPLITTKNFREENPVPAKWILLPYNKFTGKPLSEEEIKQESLLLWNYLNEHKNVLCNRKGVLINAWIRKGIWWALLGVGKYSFYPYKIVWEAYGKSSFRPKVFLGNWQANQSLQAFMPAVDKEEAMKILASLSDGVVERYLLSYKMEGTMNWAQPGKIKRLLKLEEDTKTIASIL